MLNLTCLFLASFCFEEQRLAPHEEVDMPVFFYVDPEILDDPKLDDVSSLTLSYTFFRSKDQIASMPHEMPAHARPPAKD